MSDYTFCIRLKKEEKRILKKIRSLQDDLQFVRIRFREIYDSSNDLLILEMKEKEKETGLQWLKDLSDFQSECHTGNTGGSGKGIF